MSRTILVLLFAPVAIGSARADAPKIDRTIAKEPVYQTKSPKYGLLVFGPEAKDRVWLVHDGDTLYVDRNGNGDLTEAGEKVAATREKIPEDDGYSFEVGDLNVGGRVHKGLQVYFIPLKTFAISALGQQPAVKAALAKNPRALAAGVRLDVQAPGIKGGGLGGRVTFSATLVDLAGVFQFADAPAKAPIVHCGGPLQITFGEIPSLRAGRDTDLVLVVGTPGVGPGTFAVVHYDGTIPEKAIPLVELSLPPAKPDATPMVHKFDIKERC